MSVYTKFRTPTAESLMTIQSKLLEQQFLYFQIIVKRN